MQTYESLLGEDQAEPTDNEVTKGSLVVFLLGIGSLALVLGMIFFARA